jgi:hypothetical protein
MLLGLPFFPASLRSDALRVMWLQRWYLHHGTAEPKACLQPMGSSGLAALLPLALLKS